MRIEEALRYLSKRADEAEVYYSSSNGNAIVLKKGEIELYKDSTSTGYGVRVIKGKRMGFSFANQLDEGLLDKALSVARVSGRDTNLALPTKGKSFLEVDIYDAEIAEINAEDAASLALELVKPSEDIGVIPSSASFSWRTSMVEVLSTHGVHCSEEDTACFAFVSTVAGDGEAASGFHHDASRRLDLDMAGIGRTAAELAKNSLGAKGIDKMKTSVILRPEAVAELLGNTLIPAFIADNVQRKRSPLAGRLGEKLFHELNIIDDGTMKGGLGSSGFDGEGVASQRTVLVEEGVLKGFLFDTYTGVKEGNESTGNADRDSYASIPHVDSTNFVINGRGGLSDTGLVVHGLIGAHTSNPVTGDFSVETRNAFLDGSPVKKAILSGNVYELLGNIGGLGDDVKQVFSVVTPSLEFLDVGIAG
ncbi:MAG: TldD/PmbA family protein [Candidatus Hydrothermarchaeaceae archaeon]